MKRAGPIVLVLLAATAFTAAAAGRGSSGPTADRCGGQLWRLKTLSDPGRNTVELEPTVTTIGAIVYVRGVGFWSQRRSLRGAARNGAELHPVTGLRIVAGCG